jgi:HEAT repeat protein
MRRLAAKVVGASRPAEAVPALTKAVDDVDLETAKIAAMSLGEIKSPESIARLRELSADTKRRARVWVAAALHKAGEAGTGDRFRALLGDSDAQIRREAVTALSDLPGLDPVELYIVALEDVDRQVSRAARGALERSDSPRAREALMAHLQRTVEQLAAKVAAADLRQRSEAFRDLRELGPAAAPFMMEQLERVAEPARITWASLVGQSGNPAVIATAAERLSNAELEQPLRLAYESVLRGLREQSRDPAKKLLQHAQAAVRESGVRLLLNFSDPESLALMKTTLKDESPRVRVYAAYCLARNQDPEALPILKECAGETDTQARSIAINGLAEYPGETALPVLLELARKNDRGLHQPLIMALSRFREKEATQAIADMARNEAGVRQVAIYSLARQNTPEAATAVGQFLKDEDTNTRNFARSYLQRMSEPTAKEILKKALEEEATAKEKPPAPKP